MLMVFALAVASLASNVQPTQATSSMCIDGCTYGDCPVDFFSQCRAACGPEGYPVCVSGGTTPPCEPGQTYYNCNFDPA
jgi:hypothetical protein